MRQLLTTLLSLSALLFAVGCDYFGTHEGYEDGEVPAWSLQGIATFEVVGVSPSTARAGDEVSVYAVSESDAPTTSFTVDDFWFCTFDGESAMLETGGNSYDPVVEQETVLDLEDVDITTEDLGDSTVSVVTFTVPDGTVTGEGLVFTPSSTEYFQLGIQ